MSNVPTLASLPHYDILAKVKLALTLNVVLYRSLPYAVVFSSSVNVQFGYYTQRKKGVMS